MTELMPSSWNRALAYCKHSITVSFYSDPFPCMTLLLAAGQEMLALRDIPISGTIAWMTGGPRRSVCPSIPGVQTRVPRHVGKEGPTWLPARRTQHIYVSCNCHVLWRFPENKTNEPPGSPHPDLFENKHAIVL